MSFGSPTYLSLSFQCFAAGSNHTITRNKVANVPDLGWLDPALEHIDHPGAFQYLEEACGTAVKKLNTIPKGWWTKPKEGWFVGTAYCICKTLNYAAEA